MGHHCCVPRCSSNSRHSGNGAITFHSFPVDPKERKLWIHSVRRADYKKLTVNKHTKVCSKHFRDEDFIQPQHSKRRMLKKGVVPSVFVWTRGNQEAPQCEKKTKSSSNDSGGKALKEDSKFQTSGEKSSNASSTESCTSKEAVRKLPGKGKGEVSASRSSVNTVERKTKHKRAKKETNSSSDIHSCNLSVANSSSVSSTKSDDSEQGSVSDMTPANGSSPNSSSNSTSGRKQASALSFQIGIRLEAKDLGSEIWYPVKVVEVDWDDEEILIHFEKWSQRYDEWIPMDSSRLRATQNSTSQNDSKNVTKVFSVGDRVMAKWSDSRRYPAKVKSVLGNDRYEVLFFDGFTKNIKGIRMSKLEGEADKVDEVGPAASERVLPPAVIKPVIKNEVISEAIGTKQERRERKRKINVVELFHPKKRLKLDPELSALKSSSDIEKGKKVEKGKQYNESRGSVYDVGDNEGEKSYVSLDISGSLQESVHGSKVDEAVESSQGSEDAVGRPKKKTGARSGGGADENADRSQHGGLQQGEAEGKTKAREAKSNTRKIPRKVFLGFQESDSAPSKPRRESSKGNAQEEGAPRKRKKDFLDDSSKPTNRSSRKESGKEEIIKLQTDGQTSYTVENADRPRKATVIPDKNLPSGWSKQTIQRTHGNSAGKWDVVLVNPQGRKFRSRNELRLFFEENGEPYKAEMFDFCVSGKRRLSRASDGSTASGKKMSRSSGIRAKSAVVPGSDVAEQQLPLPVQQKQQLQSQRRVKTLLPKVRHTPASQGEDDSGEKCTEPSSPPPPYTTTVAPVPANNIQIDMLEGEVLVGGLKIQMENNAFKCPKEGCGKNFRKENLLQMHLKHYHPEYNKFMGSTPNVADLAYARTIGESIDDLMPKVRYSGVGSIGVSGTSSYSEKTNRFEPNRKHKTGMAVGVGSGKSGGGGAIGGGDVSTGFEKKRVTAKEKQQSAVATKRPGKGDGEGQAPPDGVADEDKEPGEEKSTVLDNWDNASTLVAGAATATTHREEKKEQQTTIKTLLPVIRSPSHAPEISATERLKSKFPAVEEGEEYIEVIDVGARQIPPAHSGSLQSVPQTSTSATQNTTSLTKSLRTIRRRRLSDFHFEPLHKRRKITSASKLDMSEDVDVVDDGGSCIDMTTQTTAAATAGTVGTGRSTTTTYRYSKKKMPVVHLEKLNVITDSNGRVILSPSVQDQPERKLLETPEGSPVEHLRKEELINCKCGYMEEDGLMIQCDICLCWQHGLCNNIKKETEVPEKYVCSFCLNPIRQRKSKKFLHDQDWLKEGKLPSLSFRSKNESNMREREAILKRSHELTGSLLQIQQVLHSLRVKVNIAGKSDHPKLYLWAKSWEKEGEGSSVPQIPASQTQAVTENELKPQLENVVLCGHDEKKPASDTNIAVKPEVTRQKVAMPAAGHSENGGVADMCMMKPDSKMQDKEVSLELQVPEETVVVEVETSEVVSSAEGVKYENVSDGKTSGKNNETEIEEVAGENIDGNDILLLSNMGSSSSNKQHLSSSNDLSSSDVTTVEPNQNTDNQSAEDGADSQQSAGNVHEHNQVAYPVIEQEESCDTVAENLEVESEKQESCDSEICPQKKPDITDLCNALEDIKRQCDPSSVEETLKTRSEEKPDEATSQLEGHGLLHQALTNGSPVANPLSGNMGSQLDTSGHPILQLPICQSELMQLASTMADNLTVTESSRPAAAATVPVSEPPRAPQPEAPIDPVECRLRLLDHIDHFQTQIDTRLTMLEEQVAALESQDPDAAKDEAPDFYPQTKQAIQMLLRDLLTMRRIAALN